MRLAPLGTLATLLLTASLAGCLGGCGPSGARADWVEPRTAFDALWEDPAVVRHYAWTGFAWTNASLEQLAPGHYNATTLEREVGDHEVAVGGWGEASLYGPRPTDRGALVQAIAAALAQVSSSTDLGTVAEALVAALEQDFEDEPDDDAYGSERIGRAPITGLERVADRLDESPGLHFGRNELSSGWGAEISLDRVQLEGDGIELWMDARGNTQADTDDANATALRSLASALLQAHGVTPVFEGFQAYDSRVCWD